MYGWRARLALIIAHSNTVVEPEFNRLVPEGVSVHTARVRIGAISVAGNIIGDDEMRHAISSLCDINAKVFAYPCTAANIAAGIDGDLAQARLITSMSGTPAVTASAALVEALAALDAKRIVVATPYPPDLNDSSSAFWESIGVEVLRISGVDLGGERRPLEPLSSKPVSHVGLQPPYVAYNLARSAYDPRADAIVISGAGMRTAEIAGQFERDFGIPLITSSLACIWASLQAAGVREPIAGHGRLLEQQPALRWVRIPRP